jgi:hypothetical protein
MVNVGDKILIKKPDCLEWRAAVVVETGERADGAIVAKPIGEAPRCFAWPFLYRKRGNRCAYLIDGRALRKGKLDAT